MSGPAPSPYPPRRSRSTTLIVVVVSLVLVVVFVGAGLAALAALHVFSDDGHTSLTPPPKPSSTVKAPTYPAQLGRYYRQHLDWHQCGTDRCTRLEVPLDYAHPGGRSIELAVLSAPATHRGERVGQLVVNPGGPGGSGVDYAASGSFTFGQALTRYYDIVGFDPRGVGKSTPLECAGTKQTDEFLAFDPDPDNATEASGLDRVTREFGQGCLERSGDLTRHVSTIEAAKDMDILRAALGEPQLDYLGASYGTLLGATYANLFPHNVRRMVLDGAVDPRLTSEQVNLGQTHGFQVALNAYLASCIRTRHCPVGETVEQGAHRILALLDQLDAHPLPTSNGRQLTEGLARFGLILPLYLKAYWPLLTVALTEAIQNGDGTRLLALSDQYTSRGPKGYTDNSMAALNAVSCLDYSDVVPVERIPSYVPEFEKASPTFGRLFVYGLSACDSWPVKSHRHPRPIHAAGAPPIVVIGTTRDPATPYSWARSLASELDSGRLITRDGDGHTGFQQGNPCVDRAVNRYLVGGTVPRDNLSC